MVPQMSRSATTRSNKRTERDTGTEGMLNPSLGGLHCVVHRNQRPQRTATRQNVTMESRQWAVCRPQPAETKTSRAKHVEHEGKSRGNGVLAHLRSHRSWQCCRACSESSRSRFALMRRSRSHPQRAANCCEVVRRPPTNHRVLCFRKAQRDCMNAAIPSGRRPTPPRTLSARHWNTVKMPGALTSGGTDHPPSRTEHAERSMPPLGTARR